MSTFDRHPCKLWSGSYGFFDPEAPDGNGIVAPELYAQLCPDHQPFINTKDTFCAAFRDGIAGMDEVADVQGMIDLLCNDSFCEAIEKAFCRMMASAGSISDQSAWLQDYGIQQGCPHVGRNCE